MKLILLIGLPEMTGPVVADLLNAGVTKTGLIVKTELSSADIVELVNKNQIGKVIACNTAIGTAECYAKKINKDGATKPPVWLLTPNETRSNLVRIVSTVDQIFNKQTA